MVILSNLKYIVKLNWFVSSFGIKFALESQVEQSEKKKIELKRDDTYTRYRLMDIDDFLRLQA